MKSKIQTFSKDIQHKTLQTSQKSLFLRSFSFLWVSRRGKVWTYSLFELEQIRTLSKMFTDCFPLIYLGFVVLDTHYPFWSHYQSCYFRNNQTETPIDSLM